MQYSSLTMICKVVSKTRIIIFTLNLKETLEIKELKSGGAGGWICGLCSGGLGRAAQTLHWSPAFPPHLANRWVRRTSSDQRNTNGCNCIIWNTFASGSFPFSPTAHLRKLHAQAGAATIGRQRHWPGSLNDRVVRKVGQLILGDAMWTKNNLLMLSYSDFWVDHNPWAHAQNNVCFLSANMFSSFLTNTWLESISDYLALGLLLGYRF